MACWSPSPSWADVAKPHKEKRPIWAAFFCPAPQPTISAGEEIGDLDRGILQAKVRPMRRIGLDRFGEILADRAGGSGIGGVDAHDLAVSGGDGVLAFQDLNDDGRKS